MANYAFCCLVSSFSCKWQTVTVLTSSYIINEIMIELARILTFIYLLLALSNSQFVLLVIKINFVPGDGKKFIGRVMQNIFWKLSLKAASKVEPAQV